jgi:hypothetical protein
VRWTLEPIHSTARFGLYRASGSSGDTMSSAGDGMPLTSRQLSVPWTSTYCAAQTRRRGWTAGISRNQGSVLAASSAWSSTWPSAPRPPPTPCGQRLSWASGRFRPDGIALIPLRRREGRHPCWYHHGETLQRGPERLPHPLEPIEHAHRCQHMRGVGPLAATRFEQPLRLAQPLDSLAETVGRLIKRTSAVFMLLSWEGDADTVAAQILSNLATPIGLVTHETTRPQFGAPAPTPFHSPDVSTLFRTTHLMGF